MVSKFSYDKCKYSSDKLAPKVAATSNQEMLIEGIYHNAQ